MELERTDSLGYVVFFDDCYKFLGKNGLLTYVLDDARVFDYFIDAERSRLANQTYGAGYVFQIMGES